MHGKDIEIHGDYDARFEPVVRVLRKQVARYGGGASASVFLEGKPVVDVWAGQACHDGSPWKRDTMSLCFSASKGVAATAVHILATDGLLDYDAPVARYWPEFGQKGKEVITVRQVLAHQAGLHKTTPLVDDLTDILDWDKVISRLELTEPDFHPGTANGYHAMTFGWLVGELVHRVSGMSFTDFVQKRIVEPLALDGMLIGNADAELDRVADLVGVPAIRRHGAAPLPDGYRAPNWMPNGPLRSLVDRGLTPKKMAELVTHPSFWKASIPAMNGVFTARSLAKMYSALSLGGELDGTRLVSEEIVEQASQVQMKRPDKVVLYPLHWRLGYHRADALLDGCPKSVWSLRDRRRRGMGQSRSEAIRRARPQRISVLAHRAGPNRHDDRGGVRIARPLQGDPAHPQARSDHRASARARSETSSAFVECRAGCVAFLTVAAFEQVFSEVLIYHCRDALPKSGRR